MTGGAGEELCGPIRTVYPVLAGGSATAHLAVTAIDAELLGAGYRAICPAGPLINDGLRLIRADESWSWCAQCREWAEAHAISLPLPESRFA